MNPSSALAAVVVDELVRNGVREAVLSPGSRNAPLAYALHDADREGRLRLHVRIDERSAGFLALGLAKVFGQPVAVVTTSGTAAVNLHPAVVEADYAGVPLIALTADRPVELRGTGANQTIDQTGLYGGSVRHFAELSVDTAPGETEQRAMLRTALAAALGAEASAAEDRHRDVVPHPACGPVHLNVGLREPLVPDLGLGEAPSTLATQTAHASPYVRSAEEACGSAASLVTDGRRTLVVAGDGAGRGAFHLSRAGGLPLLAEPSSGARFGSNALAAYRLYLDRLAGDVERVLLLGRPTLSRPVSRLLARKDLDVVRVGGADLEGLPETDPDGWARRWFAVDAAVRRAIHDVLLDEPLSGPAVAATVVECLPPHALLVAGSSSAIRDLDLVAPFDGSPTEDGRRVLANRGASGIDGTVSTAIGAAFAHQRGDGQVTGGAPAPAYALLGDLTFLHDSNGLVLGPDETRPDLTIVVANDDGGGLFTLLEHGEPERSGTFERVFGTPHHVDLAALCSASATPHVRVQSLHDLRGELADRPRGIRVVEVPVDRSRTRDLHARLKAVALDAIGPVSG